MGDTELCFPLGVPIQAEICVCCHDNIIFSSGDFQQTDPLMIIDNHGDEKQNQ